MLPMVAELEIKQGSFKYINDKKNNSKKTSKKKQQKNKKTKQGSLYSFDD